MHKYSAKVTVVFKLAALVLITTALSSCSQKYKAAESEGFYFDTYVNIKAYSNKSKAEDITGSIFSVFKDLDAIFASAYSDKAMSLNDDKGILSDCLIQTSALNKKYGDGINLTCGSVTRIWGISTDSPVVPGKNELEKALAAIEDTSYHNGDLSFFGTDTYLDFGAVAKGYACDEAKKAIDSISPQLYEDGYAILSLGSSALLYGNKPDGSLFRTAVRNPFGESGYFGYIETESAFISTSGGYERYFENGGTKYQHIIDISTGYPAETDLASVTVIIPSETENGGLISDFLSTLIYIEGTGAIGKYLENENFYLIAINVDGDIYVSKNAPEGLFIPSESTG